MLDINRREKKILSNTIHYRALHKLSIQHHCGKKLYSCRIFNKTDLNDFDVYAIFTVYCVFMHCAMWV